VRLVKIPVLLRLARAMQRSEARDWLAVAALAQTQTERRDFLTSSKSSGVMITNGNPNFLKAHIFIYRPIL
jgi:hypothetical protein